MKKTLITLLTLALALGLVCACAEPGAADLAGSWTAECDGIPMLLLINDDNAFEAVLLEDLPIDEMTYTGSWAFDGATLTLKSDARSAEFAWDGETLTGELFDLPVVLARPTFEDGDAPAAGAEDPEVLTAEASRPLGQYEKIATPDEFEAEELLYLNN